MAWHTLIDEFAHRIQPNRPQHLSLGLFATAIMAFQESISMTEYVLDTVQRKLFRQRFG
jgi:hypothetical protein